MFGAFGGMISQKAVADLGWDKITMPATDLCRRHPQCAIGSAGKAKFEIATHPRHCHHKDDR